MKTNISTTFKNIPGKILVENADIYNHKITDLINEELVEANSYPDNLKLADVNPVFKKDERTNP